MPLLIVAGLALAALLMYALSGPDTSDAAIPDDGSANTPSWLDNILPSYLGGAPSLFSGTTLTGTNLSDDENRTIARIASGAGVDARMLAAIRIAENGGPGRQFGILSVSAPTYEAQASVAAQSISANQGRYESAKGQSATDGSGRFTQDFIRYMATRYAPAGASNDPSGLNQFWVSNVSNAYYRIEYATG